MNAILNRARGCLFGQLAGDSLGSLVEFKKPEGIRFRYPNGVRVLENAGHLEYFGGAAHRRFQEGEAFAPSFFTDSFSTVKNKRPATRTGETAQNGFPGSLL